MATEVLAMSDEDFLKLSSPPAVESTAGTESQQQEVQQPVEEQTSTEVTTGADAATAADTDQGSGVTTEGESGQVAEDPASSKDTSNSGTFSDTKSGEQGGTAATDPNPSTAGQAAKPEGEKESKDASAPGSTEKAVTTTPDYEGFYKQMIGPLKADGKVIDVKSPDEAIQLMRMGVNYTRKMQEMAPHRKVLMMLQNNGLMDEGQLSFAIDLVKHKNPEAIKKLLKESGIDPLEIDTTIEPTYREGNHRVTDEEAAFVSAVEDIQSNHGGSDTLKVINTQWDQASKDVLWKNPDIMQVIHEQRTSGVYDRVSAEVDRLKVLGAIPAQVPFLQAYKQVGDQLAQSGKLNDLIPVAAPTVQDQQQKAAPVATTVLKPNPAIKNGDKARAAAATQSTPKTAEVKVNPLAMSDEDFIKQMANRQ